MVFSVVNSGCIVNTGGKVSREELKRRVKENKEKYELDEKVWSGIVLPLASTDALTSNVQNKVSTPNPERIKLLEQKRKELAELRKELKQVEKTIEDCFNGVAVIPNYDENEEVTTSRGRRLKKKKYTEF